MQPGTLEILIPLRHPPDMLRKAQRQRASASERDASAGKPVVAADHLVPLHVAVGGDELGPSRAFLSAASLAASAR